MQVKLVCTDLVALARSRPDRHFRKITLSGVRECLLGVVSLPLEAGQKLPFGAGHLIALKPSECPLGPTPDSCAAEECRYSITSWTLESYSGNPALRKPSIISFALFDSWLRAIHADIVKAGSILSTRAAASRASASRPRWAKADARQRYGPG